MIETDNFYALQKDLNAIGKKLLDQANKKIQDNVEDELVIGANNIRNRIILSMKNTPKTGRRYQRTESGKYHTASSPYNPPAVDTGRLVASIMYSTGKWWVEVGGMVNYYKDLESGKGKIKPRPSLKPAVESEWPGITKGISDKFFGDLGNVFAR